MKRVVLSFALSLMALITVNAQDYKAFKLGIGLGYCSPSDGGGGVLLDLEPAYRINDDIAVGLRIESAAMARQIGNEEADVTGSGSYTVNGQYYLSDSKVRPYVGLGLGIFSMASASVGSSTGEVGGGSKFGFYPRLGLDIGHFNLNFDYNIIGNTESVTVEYENGTTATIDEIKNSYWGVRIGAYIFGGKK